MRPVLVLEVLEDFRRFVEGLLVLYDGCVEIYTVEKYDRSLRWFEIRRKCEKIEEYFVRKHPILRDEFIVHVKHADLPAKPVAILKGLDIAEYVGEYALKVTFYSRCWMRRDFLDRLLAEEVFG